MTKQSIYPTTFYRVSLKAIIRNSKGEVLVVKEKGGSWSLPGGGLDHGETVEEALARELYEEVSITQPFTARCLGVGSRYVAAQQAWWLLWVVYELEVDQPFTFGRGVDADEAAFIHPKNFRHSTIVSEQLVYQWCVEGKAAIVRQ